MVEETIGEKTYKEYTTESKKHLTSGISDIIPDVESYIKDFVFGDIFAREGLTKEEKVLTTITTLVAMGGCDTEVATHVNNAINVGVSSKKILDTLIQMLPYAGFARAINGIMVCKKVFDERDIDYSIDLEN